MSEAPQAHRLVRHAEALAVVRLAPGAEVPAWATTATLLSITASAAETSVVCGMAGVPTKARPQGPFTAFAVDGPLDFALTGVLSGLLAPLAEAAVPVFVVSTFDTDWVLVPAESADRAEDAWRRSGHEIQPA